MASMSVSSKGADARMGGRGTANDNMGKDKNSNVSKTKILTESPWYRGDTAHVRVHCEEREGGARDIQYVIERVG